ncbi:glycoside hydrolase family 5 protein [Pelomyxa schiedti]|nr:glycoside hydrolase family 5 protein [Pelomyxa schiedti]
MSDSDWCCSDSDQNGLWYNDRYSEQKWLSDWSSLVLRYKSQPYVIGVDLRNELRSSTIGGKVTVPAWGTGATNDWARAATAGANTVLNVNPSLLIFVEGLNYALDLTKVATSPLTLSVPGRLIYSAHDYSWDHVTNSYSIFSSELDEAWGFIMKSNESYTAPIWLGEFGTCHSSSDCVDDTTGQGRWFQMIRQYITENTLNWGYWAIDGTQSSGTGRTYDAEESYGVLNMQWSGPASQDLLSALQEIML